MRPALYPNACFYFAALFGFALIGFWPTYYGVVGEQPTYLAHAHGGAMTLWCLMLIAQASFVRSRKLAWHRAIGRSSYVLVPLMVGSTLAFAQFNMRREGLTAERLYFFYVQIGLVVVFVWSYAMAIRTRQSALIHSRYMICTSLALIDPIFIRITINYFFEAPFVEFYQIITYGLTDAVLIALLLGDRTRHQPGRVYQRMLIVFLAVQLPNFFITRTSGWRAFAQWFHDLPLS